MKTAVLLPFFAASLASASLAFAQEGEPVAKADVPPSERMSMAVGTHAIKQMGDLIAPEKKLMVLMIAKQRASAQVCEGFEVDQALFTAAMSDALSEVIGLVEEGQNNLPMDVVMFNYGVMVGGELALAAYDPSAYCAAAAEMRAEFQTEEGGDKLNVLKPGS